jgi:hypothetical protein
MTRTRKCKLPCGSLIGSRHSRPTSIIYHNLGSIAPQSHVRSNEKRPLAPETASRDSMAAAPKCTRCGAGWLAGRSLASCASVSLFLTKKVGRACENVGTWGSVALPMLLLSVYISLFLSRNFVWSRVGRIRLYLDFLETPAKL